MTQSTTPERAMCGYFARDEYDALMACVQPAAWRYVQRHTEHGVNVLTVTEWRCDDHAQTVQGGEARWECSRCD